MILRLTERHFQIALVLVCILLVGIAGTRIAADSHRKVSDLASECRWTDSRFITVSDGKAVVSNNALLSQWPFGHDVRLYADSQGSLRVTCYYKPADYLGKVQ